VEKSKILKIGLREKIILLVLQIALPFILYGAIKSGSGPLGLMVGVLLALSMLVLILLG
jgi:hypothetical protein